MSSDDPLALSDAGLLAQCSVETLRASGPGGQHRNKTDSGVRLTHRPTGVTAQAFERRSQHQNRAVALHRLRQAIAVEVRRPIDLDRYRPPAAVVAILPSTRPNRLGPQHPDFWRGAQALLDLFAATGAAVSETAQRLGLSTGQLSRLLLSDPLLTRAVNVLRAGHGLAPLR